MVLSKDLKFSICFGLIFAVIFNFYSIVFADTETLIEFVDVPNLTVNDTTMTFINSTYSNLHYVQVIPGATYRIYNIATSDKKLYYSSSIPEQGGSVSDFFTIEAGGSSGRSDYITVPDDVNYLYLSTFYSGSPTVFVYLIDEGLNNFIDDISNELTFSGLGEVVVSVVPILTISVLFGLGFYLGTRIVDKVKKAKGGV